MCSCPAHWVLCLGLDCPRAALIREAQRERLEQARALLGDPAEGVSLQPSPEPCTTVSGAFEGGSRGC